jgi:hypothetical protein
MGHPTADRLIRDVDPALGELVLDIPETERKRRYNQTVCWMIIGGEPIAAVDARLHRQTFPAIRWWNDAALQCDKPVQVVESTDARINDKSSGGRRSVC